MELIPGLTNDLARECLIRVPIGSLRSMFSVSKAWNTEVRCRSFHGRRRSLGLTWPHFILALVAWPDPDPGRFPNKQPGPSHWIMVFDPETGSWTRLPPAPRLPNFDRVDCCRVAGIGSSIVVVIGGAIPYEDSNTIVQDYDDLSAQWRNRPIVHYPASNVVHVFDLSTGQWRHGANMPGPGRICFGLAGDPISQTVLVAGGQTERYSRLGLRSTLLYDLEKDTWVPLGDMEKERSQCDVMFHDGRFHVINMIAPHKNMLRPSCAESLDPDTWQWGPGDWKFPEAQVDSWDRYWVTGKEEGDEVYRIRASWHGNHVEVRGGGGGGWRTVAHLPVELRCISCVVTWREKMLVIGGPFSSDVMQHDAFVLDLKSYEWRQESLPEEDSGFADIVPGCGMNL